MILVEMEATEVSSNVLVELAGDDPGELRATLRSAIGEHPAAGLDAAVAAVSDLLFARWELELVPRGLDAGAFSRIVAGISHEIWLWLMGDRPYQQLSAAIAGRALRRSSTPPPFR